VAFEQSRPSFGRCCVLYFVWNKVIRNNRASVTIDRSDNDKRGESGHTSKISFPLSAFSEVHSPSTILTMGDPKFFFCDFEYK
jgi:hypothetical protein